MIDHNLKKLRQKDVLNILHVYMLAFIFSELILDLFKDTLAFFTDLSFSLFDNKNTPILIAIDIIETI